MVEFSEQDDQWQIILTPNQAWTWRQNRAFLLLMAIIYALISGFCLYFGMWPVLFFSGLDLVLLFAALWWVVRKNQQKIVLRKEGDQLVLEIGRLHPEFTARFPLQWVRRKGRRAPLEDGWSTICIGQSGKDIEISHFLNQADRKKLWQLLDKLEVKPA